MKSIDSRPPLGARTKIVLWIAAWLFLAALSMDFYNWGKVPRLVLGLPLWLWAEIGLVLLIAFVYGILAHFTWDDDSQVERRSAKITGGEGKSMQVGRGCACGKLSKEGVE